jgi:hypothetical protein
MITHRSNGKVHAFVSRDDLIRLVVGMQWREAVLCFCLALEDEMVDSDGGVIDMGFAPNDETHPPACDIVDEWLGVRK